MADSIGRARHLTVNTNGDIYVKLTYNDIMHGGGGTVGLRDANNDGKADIITYFGDYKDEGGLPAGIVRRFEGCELGDNEDIKLYLYYMP